MSRRRIGVLGATSLVGDCLLAPDFQEHLDADEEFVAFSRRPVDSGRRAGQRVSWRCLGGEALATGVPSIEYWISLAPIWVLSDYYPLLEAYGVRRVAVLSSTSRYTKTDSSEPDERRVAAALISGEKQLINWAEKRGTAWIILRPTLIYGFGRDQNIASIARFVRRYGFFPLLGEARGLRQPIHAFDVATACFQALMRSEVVNRAYNISGAETLAYTEMVRRIFDALDRKPRLLNVHSGVFRLICAVSRLVPGFKDISMEMVERMNRNLVFDHGDAVKDFSFKPRMFHPDRIDVT